jgi:TP901 family phage tail tape measure protein
MAFDFTYTVGFLANMQGIKESVKVLARDFQAAPLKIGAEIKGIRTGEAQKAYDEIAKTGVEITKVTVQMEKLRGVGGRSLKEITGLVIQTKDRFGNLHQQLIGVSNSVQGIKQIEKGLIALNNKAGEWQTRSETMNNKEKVAIQSVTTKLQAQIMTYNNLSLADKRGAKGTQQYTEILKTAQALDKVTDSTKRSATGLQSWASNLQRAFVQTVTYAGSLGVVRAAQQLLNQAIQYTIQLNTEMIKIQVLQAEGAQSDAEIRSLALSYNELAKQMGSTTLEVAKGSVEWLRQGKTIAETTELLKSSTMLSKLGDLSAAEATEYLTSTLNSYKMEAKDAISVVNKLVAVDNQSATSTRELATALKYTAASAAQAGVTLEQLVSYIGVISSVTRLNAESIGQAMKTMFTRMQDIKAGQIDEDGLGLNNVESALARVDVKLRDSTTSFRDMGGVLEELAGKWDTLNEVEQANISKAIAGVRQTNMFAVLMQNMGEAIKLQAIQTDSAGLAMDRYNIYLRSVEASQNKLKASLEGLFMTASGFDKIIISINNLASGFLNLVSAVGGLPTILIFATSALIAFNAAQIATFITGIPAMVAGFGATIAGLLGVTQAAQSGTVALLELGGAQAVAMATNPAGWVILVAGALLTLGYALNKFADPIATLDRLNKKMQETQSKVIELGNRVNNVKELAEEFDKLKVIENKTAEETESFTNVQNALKKLMPELVVTFDAYGNSILSTSENMSTLTEKTKEQITVQQKQLTATANEAAAQRARSLNTLYKDTNSQERMGMGRAGATVEKSESERLKAIETYRAELERELGSFAIMGKEAQDAYIEALTSPVVQGVFEDYQRELLQQMKAAEVDVWTATRTKGDNKDLAVASKISVDDNAVIEGAEKIKAGLKDLNDIKQKVASGETFSTTDLLKIETMGLKLDIVNGKLVITDTSSKEYTETLIKNALGYAKLTVEQQSYVDSIIALSTIEEAASEKTTDLTDRLNLVGEALQEQTDNGDISTETALKLASAHEELIPLLEETADGHWKVKEGAQAALQQEMTLTMQGYALQFQEEKLDRAARMAAAGNYVLAISLIQTSKASETAKTSMISLINAYASMGVAAKVSGGGGGSGQSAADKELERIKKVKEAEKDALKAQLDAFKKIIDARKAILKAMKEESDYQDSLKHKQKEVSDIQNELLTLSLDNSEEATAKRLSLEEDLAEKQETLAEFQADRAYDLQIEALDKQYELFKEFIDAQIALIDAFIKRLEDAAKALSNIGGGVPSVTSVPSVPNPPREKTTIQKFRDADAESWSSYLSYVSKNSAGAAKPAEKYHEGVEKGFVGSRASLKSNEKFAKLLDGELVVTPKQMDKFMKNTLPTVTKTNGGNNITVEMPITVAGNLDKSVMPDLERLTNKVIEKLNDTLSQRGYVRSANQFST